MTTYVTVTDTETGHQKPLTISLVRRLRDNALAIQEGDATAPNLLLAVAAKATAGGVGTYAFLSRVVAFGSFVAGTTYAGSNLKYSGVHSQTGAAPYAADIGIAGATPSGTWRAMGSAADNTAIATLFLRIS